MKKLILGLLALTGVCAAEAAIYDGSMLYGYCTNAAGALDFTEPTVAGMAFQFTAGDVEHFRGCKITAIAVANGYAGRNSSATEQPITLFTAEEINGMGIATGMKSYEGTMDLTAPGIYKEYPLAEPIEITAETQPFWVGVTAECNPAVAGVLMFDSWQHSATIPGGLVGVVDGSDDEMVWTNMADSYGFGCIRVKIEGKGFSADRASIFDCHIPEVMAPGSTAQADMYVLNDVGNDINDITITYTLGSGEAQTRKVEFNPPLIYNEYRNFEFSYPAAAEPCNDYKVELNITQVNGENNGTSESERTFTGYSLVIDPAQSFKRNMVAEITTGTWCGFCPMAIVAVGQMLEDHKDGSFIPIAVHYNDAMETASYAPKLLDLIGQGAPNVTINRNIPEYGVRNPSYDFLDDVYPYVVNTPAMAQLKITDARLEGKKLAITSTVEFAFPTEGDYGIAYVITEDGVGPYYQTNYYNQPGAPEMMEWNTAGDYVETLYNCVARQIYLFNGATNSVPAAVEAGRTYEHTASVAVNNVTDLSKCSLIAMLVNRTTGRIENAVTTRYDALSGLSNIQTPNPSNPIYDLQGRRAINPTHGLFIQSGKIIKK